MTAPRRAAPDMPGVIFAITSERESRLARLLTDRGHTVIHQSDGPSAIARAQDEDVDLLIVSADLPGDAAVALCQLVRAQGGSERPIVIECDLPLTDAERLTMLEAGAWDCIAHDEPRFAEQILRLEACLRFRRATARERLGALTDPGTGLYNRLGLTRRARELAAQVFRNHDPVACVVFTVDLDPDTEAAMAVCAQVIRDEGRLSDIVARLGDRELAILAPRTDADGAVKLAERLARAIRGHFPLLSGDGTQIDLRAAFDAVPGVGYVPVRPIDLVIRAALSLRGPQRTGQWLRRSGPHAGVAESGA